MGIWFVKVMIVEYIVAVILFGIDGDYGRMLYFIGATVLSFGVLAMK